MTEKISVCVDYGIYASIYIKNKHLFLSYMKHIKNINHIEKYHLLPKWKIFQVCKQI